jgi:hypothetical protein
VRRRTSPHIATHRHDFSLGASGHDLHAPMSDAACCKTFSDIGRYCHSCRLNRRERDGSAPVGMLQVEVAHCFGGSTPKLT